MAHIRYAACIAHKVTLLIHIFKHMADRKRLSLAFLTGITRFYAQNACKCKKFNFIFAITISNLATTDIYGIINFTGF